MVESTGVETCTAVEFIFLSVNALGTTFLGSGRTARKTEAIEAGFILLAEIVAGTTIVLIREDIDTLVIAIRQAGITVTLTYAVGADVMCGTVADTHGRRCFIRKIGTCATMCVICHKINAFSLAKSHAFRTIFDAEAFLAYLVFITGIVAGTAVAVV